MTPATKAIAIEHQDPARVSTNQITVPLEWLTGSALGIFVLFFSIVWWVRGLSAKVDSNTLLLEELESQLEKEHKEDRLHRKELKEEIRVAFKTEIAQSASDICHGFELFAMEMRTELHKLSDGLDSRNMAVKRIARRVDELNQEVGHILGKRTIPQDNGDLD